MKKLTKLLSVLLFVAPIGFTFAQSGNASIVIDGKKYDYSYIYFSPPLKIAFDQDFETDLSTPKSAFFTMLYHMATGQVRKWSKLWAPSRINPTSMVPEDRRKETWKTLFQGEIFLLYKLVYKNQHIFVTEKEHEGRIIRYKYVFIKTDDGYRPTRDLFDDPFARLAADRDFDVAAGEISARPSVHYSFERMQDVVLIEDVAPATSRGENHSINNAIGFNVKPGQGKKGEALVFDGRSFAVLPHSVPLGFINNRFTLGLWVCPASVPENGDHDLGDDYFSSVILSREGSGAENMILEILKSKQSGKYFIRFRIFSDRGSFSRMGEIDLDVWTRISISYSGRRLRLQIGEETVAEEQRTESFKDIRIIGNIKSTFLLGKKNGTPPCFYVGAIDELTLANEAQF